MRRLREEVGSSDPETAREARLLLAVAPLSPSLARMRRVRMALEDAKPRWWQVSATHPAVAAAGLAFALAAVVQLRLRAATSGPDGRPAAATTDSAGHRRHHEPARPSLPMLEQTEAALATTPTSPQAAEAPTAAASTSGAGSGAASAREAMAAAPAMLDPNQTSAASQIAAGPAATSLNPGMSFVAGRLPLAQLGAGVLAPTQTAPFGLDATLADAEQPASAPVAATSAPSTVASGPGYGTAAVAPIRSAAGDPVAPQKSGDQEPPARDERGVVPAGGSSPRRYEPAAIALQTAPDSGRDAVALAFTGALDGRPVVGTVQWRRGDESLHAVVVHRDADGALQVHDVSAIATPRVTLDIDGDGTVDVLIDLDGAGDPDAEQKSQVAVGVVPAASIMLHVMP